MGGRGGRRGGSCGCWVLTGIRAFLHAHVCVPQAFLRAIVTHPVLREAEAVRLFLLQPGELQYNPAWIALSQQAAASEAAHPLLRATMCQMCRWPLARSHACPAAS